MSLLWATLQTQWIYDGVCVTQALLWLWVRGWKSPEALITTFCNMRILTFTHLISSLIISQSHVSNQSGLGLINRTRPLPRTWDRPNICIQYYGKGNTQKKNFFFFKLLCVCRSLFFFLFSLFLSFFSSLFSFSLTTGKPVRPTSKIITMSTDSVVVIDGMFTKTTFANRTTIISGDFAGGDEWRWNFEEPREENVF